MWTLGIPEDGDSVDVRGMSAPEVRSSRIANSIFGCKEGLLDGYGIVFISMSIDHNCDVAPSRTMSQAASLKSIL